LMPEEDPKTDLIMVATGTGIAPYRGFIRRLFVEDTPAGQAYKGQAWLFLGVANSDALLYDEFLNHPRIQKILQQNHLNEEVDYINRILVAILNPRKVKAPVKSAGILASFLKSGSCDPRISAVATLVITSMILL